MNDDQRQHLVFIQNVINRMNTNSFQIKTVTITLVTAIIGIYITTHNIVFLFLGAMPPFIFWFLDSYYLQMERKFRGVYDDVCQITQNVQVKPYEMPISKYKGKKYSYGNVFRSNTLIWWYLPIIIVILTSAIILKANTCL